MATKLVNELVEAADERQLAKTIARYGRVDLLCIDLSRARDYAEDGSAQPPRTPTLLLTGCSMGVELSA